MAEAGSGGIACWQQLSRTGWGACGQCKQNQEAE